MLKQKEVEVLRVREQLESKFREDLALQLERIGHEHANALATQAETLGAQHAAALSDEQARSRREKGEEHARLRESRRSGGYSLPSWDRRGARSTRRPPRKQNGGVSSTRCGKRSRAGRPASARAPSSYRWSASSS